jgi:preprotein translocase subunit SecA
MAAELTKQGRRALEEHASVLSGLWRNRQHREETVCTAIAATRLFHKDRHYLVRDGRVSIIDERTGRIASGRVWSQGLQQLIELKERCTPSSETVPAAQMTYQRLFRRYLGLAGMSGTLREARNELLATYGLAVVRVPLYHPDRRRRLKTRVYPTRDAQLKAVIERVRRVTATGRPVLVGTDSVIDSEELGRHLVETGVDHAVLNARQDREEARIIAAAGTRGHVTVATNMAGRGTDIALAPGVAQVGGLHVICCQHNPSGRLDRQLVGRCARRGDPGSTEALLSLAHPSVARYVPRWMRTMVPEQGFERPQWLLWLLVNIPQWLEERRHRAQRQELMRRDARTQRTVSFGRPIE